MVVIPETTSQIRGNPKAPTRIDLEHHSGGFSRSSAPAPSAAITGSHRYVTRAPRGNFSRIVSISCEGRGRAAYQNFI